MSALDLSRWQFGITTVYHFLFVPITLGLSWLVAGLQTAWYRTGDEKYLRATKFFGKIFLINIAMGVVTGIVQEFQFGMNWSDYSRFVGDIFGAPLAIEALAAFFLESTFLGIWIFGWDRLPRGLHLATIWLASLGTMLSAYFILAANSFMQHPVGYTFNPEANRAELTDFFAMLTQNTAVMAFLHTMSSAFLVSGALMAGISAWLMVRGRSPEAMRTTLRLGAVVTIVAGLAVGYTGDREAKIMVEQQPMKMAAAEALFETESGAPFSFFSWGEPDGSSARCVLCVPGLTSFLATGDFNGTVRGLNDLQAEYEVRFADTGIESFKPNIPVTYWSFRLMMGLGMLGSLFGVWALWLTRRGRRPGGKWLARAGIAVPFLPLAGIAFGWIFTEMGRQPWLVFGLMPTSAGVSPGIGAGHVWTSLIAFTLLYGALAVVELRLLARTVQQGPPEDVPEDPYAVVGATDDRPLTIAY